MKLSQYFVLGFGLWAVWQFVDGNTIDAIFWLLLSILICFTSLLSYFENEILPMIGYLTEDAWDDDEEIY